jgi:hypothetical protein
MATSAFLGSLTLLQVGNGLSPQTFTTIGEGVTISPIAQKKDLVEVTHFQSTAKEFIGGLSEGQEITVTCNYIPGNTQQNALIIAAATITAAKDFRYVMPSGGSNLKFSFSALVLGSSVGPTTPNTATQVTFTLKISGAIVGPIG